MPECGLYIPLGDFRDEAGFALSACPLYPDSFGEQDIGLDVSTTGSLVGDFIASLRDNELTLELQGRIPEGKHIRLGRQWGEGSSYHVHRVDAARTQSRYYGLGPRGIAVYEARSRASNSSLLKLNWQVKSLPFLIGRPNSFHNKAYEKAGGRVEDIKVSLEIACAACGIKSNGSFIDTEAALFYLGREIVSGDIADPSLLGSLKETFGLKFSELTKLKGSLDLTPAGVLTSRIYLLSASRTFLEGLGREDLLVAARESLVDFLIRNWQQSLQEILVESRQDKVTWQNRILELLCGIEADDHDQTKAGYVESGDLQALWVPHFVPGMEAPFEHGGTALGISKFEAEIAFVLLDGLRRNFGLHGWELGRVAIYKLKNAIITDS